MAFISRALRALVPVLLVLCTGCSMLPPVVSRTPSYALADTDSTRIGQVATALTAGRQGQSGTYPLFHGLEAFAARWQLAEAAERTLDVQYYIWHPDTSGILMARALWDAAERGVRVRVLLDDGNTAGLDADIMAMEAHPNIEVRLFNPFANRTWRIGDFVSDFGRVHRRMHNKSFTADNQVTVVGGRNIGDEYLGGETAVAFMDMDLMVVGPVVQEVSADFDEYWNSASAYPVRSLLPPLTGVEQAQLRDKWAQRRAGPQAVRYLDSARSLSLLPQMRAGTLPLAWGRAFLLSDDPDKVLHPPERTDLHMTRQLAAHLENPVSELLLVSPYFVPGRQTTEMLVGLVARGVKVSVLTNSLAATDVPPVYAGYMRYRDDLLRGGVRIYELKPAAPQPGLGREDEARVRGIAGSMGGSMGGSSGASLHAKTMAVDRGRIFVGSYNLDPRSARLNTELGLLLECPELAGLLAGKFEAEAPKVAYELQLAADGSVVWLERTPAGEVRHTSMPEVKGMRLFWTRLIGLFPIEWLL